MVNELNEITELKKAEEEAKLILEKAEKNKENKLQDARRKAREIVDNARQECIDLRKGITESARKDIEKESAKILKKAESEAEGLKSKKIPAADAKKLAGKVLGV